MKRLPGHGMPVHSSPPPRFFNKLKFTSCFILDFHFYPLHFHFFCLNGISVMSSTLSYFNLDITHLNFSTVVNFYGMFLHSSPLTPSTVFSSDFTHILSIIMENFTRMEPVLHCSRSNTESVFIPSFWASA